MKIKKFLDIWTTVLWYLSAVLVLATIIVISMQIIWRYVFSNPLSWTEQVSRYLFVWIVMMAVPVGLYRNGLYNFDLLLDKFRGKAALVVKTINYLACLIFTGYYFFYSVVLCVKGGWRFAQGVHIRMLYLYIAQPICAATLFLIFLYQVIEVYKAYFKNKK